ncbi:MAG: hypothetical protein ACETWR_13175 [Anaerolineae bacterium]
MSQRVGVGGGRLVLVLEIGGRPGAFGEVSRRITNAGENIDLVYRAMNSRRVLGADDLDKARPAV